MYNNKIYYVEVLFLKKWKKIKVTYYRYVSETIKLNNTYIIYMYKYNNIWLVIL